MKLLTLLALIVPWEALVLAALGQVARMDWLGHIPFLPGINCNLIGMVSALPVIGVSSKSRWLMPELLFTKSAKEVTKGCQPELQPPESLSHLATE